MTVYKHIAVFLINLSIMTSLYSQELKKEVYVESSYKPEIADADKINRLPRLDDTVSYTTDISYRVIPSKLHTEYDLRPIKPAKMVGSSLDKLYNSYLKLGMGSRATPLIEYSIHNLRSKDYSVGAYLKHRSSFSKIKLENDEKVPAGFSTNNIGLFGKKFLDNANIEGRATLIRNQYKSYGYNMKLFDTIPEIIKDSIRQTFFDLNAGLSIYSTDPDSNAFNYNLGVRGGYFVDYHENKEPYANIYVKLNHPINEAWLGLDASFEYFSFEGEYDTSTSGLISISPYFSKKKNDWEIKLGTRIDIMAIDSSEFHIYPDAEMRIQIAKDAVVTFFGARGRFETNSYRKLLKTNPYIVPGTRSVGTNHVLIAYAGVEGAISHNAEYRLSANLDVTEDSYFFIDDTMGLGNHFTYILSDPNIRNVNLELSWSPLEYLAFYTHVNYYEYMLPTGMKPCMKQDFDASLLTRYNFKKKIYADIEFTYIGKRYAKNLFDENKDILMDPIFDINVNLEYIYSNVLSAFLQFNNLANQHYNKWNHYPNYGFGIIGGISYKF